MEQVKEYEKGPSRDELDQMKGAVLLEFGVGWCPYCQALESPVATLAKKFPGVKHLKVEDGKGKPLGRSFRVKLWPSFVFLKDGQMLNQLARPSIDEVEAALKQMV